MGNDLLPCPFCGGTAEIYNPFHMIGNPGKPATYRGGVRCGACGCEAKATTPPYAAVIAWNRRADAAPQASEAVRWVVTDDMRAAVRFAPSSAHWSERLKEFFGPDAREGINALEKQLREARADLDRQKHASEAVRSAALEEAAKQCEDIYSWRGAYSTGVLHQTTLDACASAIRTLKTQADKDGGDCAKGAGDE